MNETEKETWQAFRGVVDGFLGNKKNPHYKEFVEQLIKSYQNIGCHMSVKLHFLWSHLEFFQENLGDFSEEHGERFYKNIEPMKRRYKGRWDSEMMGDYIWSLIRQDKSVHKWKACSTLHFWMPLIIWKNCFMLIFTTSSFWTIFKPTFAFNMYWTEPWYAVTIYCKIEHNLLATAGSDETKVMNISKSNDDTKKLTRFSNSTLKNT